VLRFSRAKLKEGKSVAGKTRCVRVGRSAEHRVTRRKGLTSTAGSVVGEKEKAKKKREFVAPPSNRLKNKRIVFKGGQGVDSVL